MINPFANASHDDHDGDRKTGRAVAAVFDSRAEARQAIAALHKHHYTHSWFGVTSRTASDGGKPVVTIENPGFFSLKSQHIVDAFVEHGVRAETARALEPLLTDGTAIVIVDPKDKDPGEVTEILRSNGGEDVDATVARSTAGQARVPAGRTMPAIEDDGDIDYREEIYFFTTTD